MSRRSNYHASQEELLKKTKELLHPMGEDDDSDEIIDLLPEMRRIPNPTPPRPNPSLMATMPVHAQALQKLYIHKLPAHIDSLRTSWEQIQGQKKATTEELLRLYQKILLLNGLGLSCCLKEFHIVTQKCLSLLNTMFRAASENENKSTLIAQFAQQLVQLESLGQFATRMKVSSIPSMPAVPAAPSENPTLSYHGTVLVVDDDPDQRNLIQFTLESQNIQSILCSSGEEALLAIKATTPDIVLLDIKMPGMDGFSTFRAIRNIPGLETIPVLFLTGNQDESKILEAYKAGADDYIQKPFNPSIFIAKLKQILQRQLQQRLLYQGELQPGLVLNHRYEVLTELARGGMGIVYMIRHLTTGKLLALKSISVHQSRRSHQLQRFQREAHFLFQLHHPSLIRILDAGIHQNVPYYVMRLMPGGTLLDHLEQGAFPPQVALAITIQMADALHDAHQQGVLHRDLKSTNILFDERGRPILTDFGSAVTLGNTSPRLTRSGHVIGTPCYMSPEQLRSPQDVDHRSDVFSLGFVLYEMLAGKHPFANLPPTDVMARIITQRIPPLESINPNVPEALLQLCKKSMSHEMDQRFGTAKEFADACRKQLQRLPTDLQLTA